jgi:hypothetical protein
VNRTDLPLTPVFINTPGTALLHGLRGIEFMSYMLEEGLIVISTGQQKPDAPCILEDNGSDLEKFKTNRSTLRPRHLFFMQYAG